VTTPLRLGVIGTGALGGAIARAALRAGVVTPRSLHLANCSGRAEGFADWPALRVSNDPQDLAEGCEMLLLAIPPAALADLRLDARDLPVLSVMAGATVAALTRRTGSVRILRAMSSPAAELGLAYSPVFAAPAATAEDRDRAAGTILATDPRTPADHVAEMIAYAGTTAAGLRLLQESDLARIVDRALAAATARARTIAAPDRD
jgi:pyrroline-5-carboxylate reductase